MLSAHDHALSSHCCWRDSALLSAEVLPAQAGSGWGSNSAPRPSHHFPANWLTVPEWQADSGPPKMSEVGVKNFQKVHSESCLAYRKVTSCARPEQGVARVRQGVRWAPSPGWVARSLVFPCTPSPCTALVMLAQFLLKEEFTSEDLKKNNALNHRW